MGGLTASCDRWRNNWQGIVGVTGSSIVWIASVEFGASTERLAHASGFVRRDAGSGPGDGSVCVHAKRDDADAKPLLWKSVHHSTHPTAESLALPGAAEMLALAVWACASSRSCGRTGFLKPPADRMLLSGKYPRSLT